MATADESWHVFPPGKTLKVLDAGAGGLEISESQKRRREYGLNELDTREGPSPLKILLNQFKNPLVGLLLLAVLVSFMVGHDLDALMILAIVVVNAILGFTQDWKAERAIEAMSALFVRHARVLRKGEEEIIDAKLLVPGDIIIVEAGDEVPADARLIDVADLQVSEAPLTGESLPIYKKTDAISKSTPLPERNNMIFAGTLAMNGWAKAVVVATGMRTELGKIAGLTQKVEKRKTHTEEMLGALTRRLMILFLVMCIAITAIGIFLQKDSFEMLLIGISLAVAAIPEGLPAVVTIVFAIGLRRLGAVNTLVRKLSATETLGALTYICTDKTGTLTKNQMTAKLVFVDGEEIGISGTGYSTKGRFSKKVKSLQRLLEVGVLCNHASLKDGKILGDPTEASILVAAAKAGIDKHELDKSNPILGEISFSMERKMMSVITKTDGKTIMNTKGGPEVVLARCNRYLWKGKVCKITPSKRKYLLETNEILASMGYRVLGIAYKEMKSATGKEEDLIYAGSIALIDPVRPEAVQAIRDARKAGIRVTIVTGDHKSTATAIADQVGLMRKDSIALSGSELEELSDEELRRDIDKIKVFARVTPEQKMRVLGILQDRGEIVGMTGDGVNDAPALKKADVGISMGKSGTDVARETAEIVLADDNFASIVKGISEGRTIFLNIRKFVYYLVSSNIAEVMIIFFGMLLGWPLVLVPIQILWINLVTDSITALSLGVEPKPKDVMENPPRNPEERILTGRSSLALFGVGAIKTAIVLYVFSLFMKEGTEVARTMAFVGLIICENFNLFNFKDLKKPMHASNPFNNKYLLAALLVTVLLTMLVVQLPYFSPLFHTTPLDMEHWVLLVGFGSLVLVAGEIYKNLRYYGILRF